MKVNTACEALPKLVRGLVPAETGDGIRFLGQSVEGRSTRPRVHPLCRFLSWTPEHHGSTLEPYVGILDSTTCTSTRRQEGTVARLTICMFSLPISPSLLLLDPPAPQARVFRLPTISDFRARRRGNGHRTIALARGHRDSKAPLRERQEADVKIEAWDQNRPAS